MSHEDDFTYFDQADEAYDELKECDARMTDMIEWRDEKLTFRQFPSGAVRDGDNGKYELAWAAGLFDGEGSVTHCREGKRLVATGERRLFDKLYVGNTDRELLDRFQEAVGAGKVRGPYGRRGREGQSIKPMFHWTATHRQARIAAEKLLPFLGSAKGALMERAMRRDFRTVRDEPEA